MLSELGWSLYAGRGVDSAMHDNHHHAHRASLAAHERPTSDEPAAVAAAHGTKKNKRNGCTKRCAKSTASEAQRERIVTALRAGPKASYELRRLGCYQCPARIINLRRLGFNIFTERVTLYDLKGYAQPRAARYHLQSEPDGERP